MAPSLPAKPLSVPIVTAVLLAKLVLHLFSITRYGFHRDELLYLAQGHHPSWGYWSTPPFTGWVSFVTQHLLGDSLWATRLPALLASCLVLFLVLKSVSILGGGRFAQVLAGLGMLVSPAPLRSAMLFQPVGFDILFWTLLCYCLLRYLKHPANRWLYLFGATFGFSLLNKYMPGIFLLALFPALLLTGQAALFGRKAFWLSVGIALLLFAPNLLWQWQNQWPVFGHFSTLSETQLVNVGPVSFLVDQLFMYAPALLLWLAGVYYLLAGQQGRYRALGLVYLLVVVLLLVLHGKSYYTLGMYPVLVAAGSVWWAQVARSVGSRVLLGSTVVVLGVLALPISLAILPVEGMVNYGKGMVAWGADGPLRWEDGEIHDLPQDYADMLGWPELGVLVDTAITRLPAGTPYMVYGAGYGRAAAIDRFSQLVRAQGIEVVSFSDAYLHWVPRQTDAVALIYVDDELSADVDSIFNDIQLIGRIQDTRAREHGTAVYLCQEPVAPFSLLWAKRIEEVLGNGMR